MILVTVGTEKYPFNRLMLWLELLIKQGFLAPEQEEVIVQYGNCTFLPTGVTVYPSLPEAEFINFLEKAKLVIGHCGEGTLDLLTKLDKRFILVPRQHCLGEHLDDHQMELAEALSLLGFSIAHSPGDIARFLFSDPSYPMIDFAAIIKDNLCRDLIARFPPNQ